MAGAAFGDVAVTLFVAGAIFGDVAVSLFVAGTIFLFVERARIGNLRAGHAGQFLLKALRIVTEISKRKILANR